jgi:flagellar motor switch protein FliN/FliY
MAAVLLAQSSLRRFDDLITTHDRVRSNAIGGMAAGCQRVASRAMENHGTRMSESTSGELNATGEDGVPIEMSAPSDSPQATSAATHDQEITSADLMADEDFANSDAIPIEHGTLDASASLDDEQDEEPAQQAALDESPVEMTASTIAHGPSEATLRALRILPVPVTVSVLLAERKMPVGQVAGLVPGALITFNKSCEDLLDLFVNNHRHCQGEAVKIGEHFGLKIARVGVTEGRKEHVV